MEQKQTLKPVLEQAPEPEQKPTSENREAVETPSRWKALACWACCVFFYILSGIFCGFFCGIVFGGAFRFVYWSSVTADSFWEFNSVGAGILIGVLCCMALGVAVGTTVGEYAATVRGAFWHWLKCGSIGTLVGALFAALLVVLTSEHLPEALIGPCLHIGLSGGIIGATLGCWRYCTKKWSVWHVATILALSLGLGAILCVMVYGLLKDDIPDNALLPNCVLFLIGSVSFVPIGAMFCVGLGLNGSKKGAIWGSLIGLLMGLILGMAVSVLIVEHVSFVSAIFGALLGVTLGSLCGLTVGAGISSGFAARAGWLCVICILFTAAAVALYGVMLDDNWHYAKETVTLAVAILNATCCAVIGAMYSALLSLKTGLGSVLGSRRTEFGVIAGLVLGIWVLTHVFVPDLFVVPEVLMVLPCLFVVWCVIAAIGGLFARILGVGAVYGAWFGGIFSLTVVHSVLFLTDRGICVQWFGLRSAGGCILLSLVIGMLVGAAVGALLGRHSQRLTPRR